MSLLPSSPFLHCPASRHTVNGLVTEATDLKDWRVVRFVEMVKSLNLQRWCFSDNLASCMLSAGSQEAFQAMLPMASFSDVVTSFSL